MDAQPSRHEALHHGLAAIAIGAVFLLMTFPAFQLCLWLQVTEYRGWRNSDKELAAYGGYIGTAIVLALCVVGTFFGVRGMQAASRTGEPRVLCQVGAALSLFAAAVWIMLGVSWHMQAGGFIK
jgi:hypothetical protein